MPANAPVSHTVMRGKMSDELSAAAIVVRHASATVLTSEASLQRRGIAIGADNERADRLRDLAKRHIHFVWRRLVQVRAFHVSNHADDFAFNLGVAAAEQYFAKCGFAGEKSFRERLVDDADIW